MMAKKTAVPSTTPQFLKGGGTSKKVQKTTQRSQFVVMALNMSWQLAVVIFVPIIGGVQLDKAWDTSYVFTLAGVALGLVGSGLVMWRTLQVANRLPVPKLSAAQKRAIKKQYEAEDEE
jgi:hypothetical protein